jgi:hypothetical protein
MSQFQLFDTVKLKESISLSDGGSAPLGTSGAIVEIFKDGEAFMVELFGGWVREDKQGSFVPTARSEKGAFVETIGVETVRPDQLQLIKPARETMGARGHLATIVEDLPEELVAEVRDFAEFLAQKQQIRQV